MIFDCAKFNSRQQKEGKSVDSFITDLHCLANTVTMENFKVKCLRQNCCWIIRHQLINKIADGPRPELTLEKATTAA